MESPENMMFSLAHKFLAEGNFVDAILTLQRLDDYYLGLDSAMKPYYYTRQKSKRERAEGYNGWVNYALLGINLLFTLQKMRNKYPTIKGQDPKLVATNYLKYLHDNPKKPRLHYKLLSDHFLEQEAQKIFKETAKVHKKSTRARLTKGLLQKEYDKVQSGIALLHEVKHFNHLHFLPQIITTSFQLKDKSDNNYTVTIKEIPLCNLTKELQDEYLDYQARDWFLNANNVIQPYLEDAVKLINDITLHNRRTDEYNKDKPKTLHRNKKYYPVIPTELRYYMPGLRNAFIERLSIQRESTPKKELVLFESYHFANPGHLTQGDNNRLTHLSQQQFQYLTGAQQTFIHTLVSPNNIFNSYESTLTEQNIHTAKNTGIHFSNTGIGAFRGFTDRFSKVPSVFTEGVEHQFKVLQKIKDDIDSLNREFRLTVEKQEKQLKVINEKLQKRPPSEATAMELKSNQEELLSVSKKKSSHEYWLQRINTLNKLIQSYRSGSGSTEFFSGDNRNLMLTLYIKQIMYAYNQIYRIIYPQKEQLTAHGDGCVNGKERGAILRLYTYAETLLDYFADFDQKSSYTQEFRKHLLYAVAESTHFQKMASHLGGSFGAYGLKDSASGAFIHGHDKIVGKLLFSREAFYNSELPSHAKKSKLNYFTAPVQTYYQNSRTHAIKAHFIQEVISKTSAPKPSLAPALPDKEDFETLRFDTGSGEESTILSFHL